MARSKVSRQEATESFKADVYNMLLVHGKNNSQAGELMKDNENQLNSWVASDNSYIVTAAMAARILLATEKRNLEL